MCRQQCANAEVVDAGAQPASASDAPMRFEIHVQKNAGDFMGAFLGDTCTGAVVLGLKDGGIIHKWNNSNPHCVVRQGFVIEELNGLTGYWNIIQEIVKSGPMTLKVNRSPPTHDAADWRQLVSEVAGSKLNEGLLLRLQPRDPGSASESKFRTLPCLTAAACGVDQCAICLDDVEPDETLVQLPCKHAYHRLCAARWLAEQGASRASAKKQFCPLCCQRLD